MLFFEHKHLYRRIKGEVPDERYTTPIGEARIHQEGDDVTVVTWGAMVYTAEEAAAQMDDLSVEIVDLRTVLPWDKEAVLESVRKTSKVIVLHEDTHTGGFGAEIAATIAEEAFEDLDAPPKRITAPDTPVPFAPVLEAGVPPAGRRRRRRAARGRRSTRLMATGTVVDVVMPQMGVSVSEGTVTRWLKNVGDTVEADEPLLEISTDKVDTEVPSPGTGVLQEILVQEGETVAVGTVLARIGPATAAAAAGAGRTGAAPEPPPSPSRARGRAAMAASRAARPSRWRRARAARAPPPAAPAADRERLRAASATPSSRRSSRGSPPSTGSTRRPSRAPAATAA